MLIFLLKQIHWHFIIATGIANQIMYKDNESYGSFHGRTSTEAVVPRAAVSISGGASTNGDDDPYAPKSTKKKKRSKKKNSKKEKDFSELNFSDFSDTNSDFTEYNFGVSSN